MTTTIYHPSHQPAASPAAGLAPGPAPLHRVLVVGGGTAGWMTALILGRVLLPRGGQVTLVESPTVGTIGVGEGSTPWLRGFFDDLGIDESEWMPACHATYKCGIRFEGWSTRPGFESYFHPFASMLDNLTMPQFVHNAEARLGGADVHAHPDRFFVAQRLAAERRGPKPDAQFPFDIWHGYHFDSGLLGEFLQRKATARGVRHLVRHVTGATLDGAGNIASVSTSEGELLEADLYVDCTGFAGLLIDKLLATPFVSFAANLFNDAAIAMPTPIERPGEGGIPSETVSTALRHGWAWRIPLTSRYGNGYVYSSQSCSADEAEQELRARLGLLDAAVPARHLKMKVGRVTRHWNRNCLAIGLSQGFIEPLEATALYFIQKSATRFAGLLERGELDEPARERYNAAVNEHFEGTRDYIVTHFKGSSRSDTEYWRANAANLELSAPLRELLTLWMNGRSLVPAIREQGLGRAYPVFSWYSILAGSGIFPGAGQLRAPTPDEGRYDLREIDDLIRRSATNYRDHREVLAAIPQRRPGPALQVYFW
jgi:2-polyprenyl-6-methoxyphenol hydroxylase-like FAD-dependent oxidoreductase